MRNALPIFLTAHQLGIRLMRAIIKAKRGNMTSTTYIPFEILHKMMSSRPVIMPYGANSANIWRIWTQGTRKYMTQLDIDALKRLGVHVIEHKSEQFKVYDEGRG
jgi:hypothetical protein